MFSNTFLQHGRVKVRTTAEVEAQKAKVQEEKLAKFLGVRAMIFANVSANRDHSELAILAHNR